ncbi:hypothetical protein AB0F18_29170 [Streptomyces sp. NPDC029216]|uniref:hypothetical protein n=1 Tax=Streptomyces sp. NPDC029216 TaxID=3154701 RepID=UPI0033F61951
MRASVGGDVLEAVELGRRGVEADLESFDLSEPAVTAGLADAVAEVLDDLDEAATLAWIDLEDRAADAGLSGLRAVAGQSVLLPATLSHIGSASCQVTGPQYPPDLKDLGKLLFEV